MQAKTQETEQKNDAPISQPASKGKRESVNSDIDTYETIKVCPSIIDADTWNAFAGIRGAAAAIESTAFRDVVPFNPAKFISDRVGS